ncbi:MAG: hypothetical protein WAO09_10435 [Candidatus Dormiibacterota bacterium]
MPGPTADEDGGLTEPQPGDRPRYLGDLQTSFRIGRIGWLIVAMLVVAAISFFIVVVCLGVDTS